MEAFSLSDMLYGWYYTDHWNGLTEDEKEHNASAAMTLLRRGGFTIYAAAGIVGNMWAESMMNPGQWEGDTAFSGGYGLVQWTPYTLYSEWAVTDWENNGPKEIERIFYEKANGLEFYPSQVYPMWTWSRFARMGPEEGQTDIDSVNQAAEIFLYNYLRPSNPAGSVANRRYHARYVYQHCPGSVIPVWLLGWWNLKNRKVIP